MPNVLDVAQLDRPKLDGARFHLGLVGMVPSRKRLDLALDVLEELRREDDRYLLFVKSGMPWEHWWVWQNPAEREHYASALRRVQRSPLLRGAVVFDDAGPDVAAWLRRVGFVLSTSDDESFHVAPAEGMVSRAVPVLRHWPGAETIYDMRWIHRGPAEMAAAIMALGDEHDWRAAGDDAHAQAAAAFNLARVGRAWHGLLTADLDPAVPGPILELLGSPLTAHVLHARRQRGHREACAALTAAAERADPRVMPIPGPGARSLACSRRSRRRAALGRRARPRRMRGPAYRTPGTIWAEGATRARPHGPGPRRPGLPGRGPRRGRGQRPGLLGGRRHRAAGRPRPGHGRRLPQPRLPGRRRDAVPRRPRPGRRPELRLIDGRLGYVPPG